MMIACITGATGGLGKAFATECAQRGYGLFLTDVSQKALTEFANGLERNFGVNVATFACDLADETDRERLCAELAAYKGRFGILVNVAGLDFEGLFCALTLRQIRLLMRLNIEAAIELTHEILPLRMPGEPFRVINVCSAAAFQVMPYKALYAASKRFLLNWSLALNEELRRENVTVTALCPGGLPTTPESIESIGAQGVLGAISTKNVPYVADLALRRAHRGAGVVIPGAFNRLLSWLGSALPLTTVARTVSRRWSKTRSRIGQMV